MKKYPHILIKLKTKKIDELYIDSNAIVYNVLHKLDDEYKKDEHIISGTITEIESYRELFNNVFTFISFDGVPPFAKISQQRQRRYKSSIMKIILKTDDIWDTCSITPGTLFMELLNKQLYSKYNSNDEIKLSTSNENGEGEHKIFEYIRNNSNSLIDKNICIYGLDADLIMLSLYHVHLVKNIYLYRETPIYFSNIIPNIDLSCNHLLDVNELKNTIEKICPINDYLFLTFLLGNDFLPHFPTLNIRQNGIIDILNGVTKFEERVVDNDLIINWNVLRKFLSNQANFEEDNFRKLHMFANRKNNKYYDNKDDTLLNIPSIDKRVELSIRPFDSDWEYRYYKNLFDIDINNDKTKVQDICINYLQGLEWCFKYYIGQDIDWTWSYKYHYPPLLTDLIKYIPFYNMSFVVPKSNIFTESMQLCYVLPQRSLNLLPEDVLNKLPKKWYRNDCEIIWAFCKYFWEAHILLPDIHLDELSVLMK
jgi:5'-3' exonuclease